MLQGAGKKQSVYKIAAEFNRIRTRNLRYVLCLILYGLCLCCLKWVIYSQFSIYILSIHSARHQQPVLAQVVLVREYTFGVWILFIYLKPEVSLFFHEAMRHLEIQSITLYSIGDYIIFTFTFLATQGLFELCNYLHRHVKLYYPWFWGFLEYLS